MKEKALPETYQRALALLLTLVLFALLVFSVELKSSTSDEQNHVARGLAYLKTGDLRLSQEHPPGVNVWQTWPLLLDPGVRLPLDSPSWTNAEWYGFADQLLWVVNDRPQAMIFATRVPVMWLTLILAVLVYRWARELGGERAGLIAFALLAFDPNILAHGRLTTTDMGVTCAAFAAMYSLWRALRERSRERSRKRCWQHWILTGVYFGAAQLAKFSALVLGPSVLLIMAAVLGRRWIGHKSFTAREAGLWALRLLRFLALVLPPSGPGIGLRGALSPP
jgi:4-amino-4-deoxy-L-arabinose transferase-like glycosyltransferase